MKNTEEMTVNVNQNKYVSQKKYSPLKNYVFSYRQILLKCMYVAFACIGMQKIEINNFTIIRFHVGSKGLREVFKF